MTDNDADLVGQIAIDERNILVNAAFEDRTELIRRLGGLLFANGYVRDSYVQAVLEREIVFPTGLQTTALGIAIPHTDAQHVYRSAIAVATLTQPVIFQEMGSPENEVAASIVMMLAVSDPKAIIPVLRSILFLLEEPDMLRSIAGATAPVQVRDLLQEHVRAMAARLAAESSSIGHD